jgi:prepilin-type N-terminal cleavage/methylation domain-containing protein
MKFRPANQSQTANIYWLMGVYFKTPRAARSGFTLIELLVALIISIIITGLLLFSTVRLMAANQREASRSDTQREIQAALDYISRDLREAVYVYDGECLRVNGAKTPPGLAPGGNNTCPGILSYLPAQLNDATNLPVLAFWRVDPLPPPLQTSCRASARQIVAGTAAAGLQDAPCGSGKMYTLVVYSINRANAGGVWQGRARITRYTLPQYTFSGAQALQPTPGWTNPLVTGFVNWPRDPVTNTLPAGRASNIQGNNQVLVDFVDDENNDGAAAGAAAVCPVVNGTNPEQFGGFYVSPAQGGGLYNAAADLSRRAFYACVRGGDAASLNQEVIVRIRGTTAGQVGIPINNQGVPITMETRTLIRGVLGKN